MKQTHRLYKISLLAFAFLGFLTGCSSEPTSTSTIEVSSDGTVSISQDNIAVSISNAELNAKRIQHYEVLDSNVTYNGKEIARPEGSTLKIKHEGSSIFIYIDDKLVQEVRIEK